MSINLLDSSQNHGTFRVETSSGALYRITCFADPSRVRASGGSLILSDSMCWLMNNRICVGESMILTEPAESVGLGRRKIETSDVVKIVPLP